MIIRVVLHIGLVRMGCPLQWRIYIVKFWMRTPPGPKFFQFHAVFGKIWQNRMLMPPRGVGIPSLGKS